VVADPQPIVGSGADQQGRIRMNSTATVQVSVGGGPSTSVPWVAGMSAQQAMEAAFNALNNSQTFTYALQYYGSQLGYLVMMINETYDSFVSSAAPFFYWEFLLNGAPAQQGIDSTKLHPGDAIAFNFEAYDSVRHVGSTLAKKHEFQMTAASNS
jgi:hypothetical protein